MSICGMIGIAHVFAQNYTLHPAPNLGNYAYLQNISSRLLVTSNAISTPHSGQIIIENNNNFTLYNVKTDFNSPSMALYNETIIDVLNAHSTKEINGTLVRLPDHMLATDAFWEITAQNESNTMMRSIMFQRSFTQYEFLDIPLYHTSSLSPLAQFKSGVDIKDITCKQSFQLVIKIEDGSPACVKPNTSIVLIERGWAKASQ